MHKSETASLFDFYNERLKRAGVGEEIHTAAQLSQLERIPCAASGVGMPLLTFWLLGRTRAKTMHDVESAVDPESR